MLAQIAACSKEKAPLLFSLSVAEFNTHDEGETPPPKTTGDSCRELRLFSFLGRARKVLVEIIAGVFSNTIKSVIFV